MIYATVSPVLAHGHLYEDEMNLIYRDRTFIPPTESDHDFQNYRNYIQFLKAADQMQDVDPFDHDIVPTKNHCQKKIMALLKECYAPQRYAFYTNAVYIMNENHSVQKYFLKRKNTPEAEITNTILTTCNAIINLLHEQTPGDRYQIIKSTRHVMQELNGMQHYCALELVQFLADQTQSATDIVFGEKRCTFVGDFQGIIGMHMCHQIRKRFVGGYPQQIFEAIKKITERVVQIKDPESRVRTIKGTCFIMSKLRAQHELYSVPKLIDRLLAHEPHMDRFLAVISHLFESKRPQCFLEIDHIYTLCTIDISLLEQTVRELNNVLDRFFPAEYSRVIQSVHKKEPTEMRKIVTYSFLISDVLTFLTNKTFYYAFVVEQLSQYASYLNLIDQIQEQIDEYKSDCCHLFSWIMPEYVREKRKRLKYDLSKMIQPIFPGLKLYH